MRILLIKPRWFVHGGVYRFLENIKFTPLHISIIGALSKGHDVTLVDNDWEEIPYEKEFDLVGITTTTFTSERAYAIADRFRDRGAKVVLGGVHASLLPDECLQHADAVVIGEAEYVWPKLLKDVENGKLQSKYVQAEPVDINDVPVPARELLDEDYRVATVQATRGCSNICRFCYLPNVPWHAHRKRDINLVYEELKGLRQRIVFFVDDNMFVDEDYVIELCGKIAPLKKIWSIQAPSNIAYNDRMLAAMRKAGCFHVQVGFQTVNPGSLEWAQIRQNRIENYRYVVRQLHRYKMLVVGFFMFGFDHDDRRVFEATASAIRQIDLDDIYLYILTPYPGTGLYDSFKREGRLLEKDRSNYGWANAVFEPKLMTPRQLEEGVQSIYEKILPHFSSKAPLKILSRLSMFLRYPHLFSIVVAALRRRIDIRKKPV